MFGTLQRQRLCHHPRNEPDGLHGRVAYYRILRRVRLNECEALHISGLKVNSDARGSRHFCAHFVVKGP